MMWFWWNWVLVIHRRQYLEEQGLYTPRFVIIRLWSESKRESDGFFELSFIALMSIEAPIEAKNPTRLTKVGVARLDILSINNNHILITNPWSCNPTTPVTLLLRWAAFNPTLAFKCHQIIRPWWYRKAEVEGSKMSRPLASDHIPHRNSHIFVPARPPDPSLHLVARSLMSC